MIDYALLETRITAWATARPDLVAGVVVGSRGRSDHPADEWSDLDLVIFSTAAEAYILEGAWLEEFGVLWAAWLDNTGSGYPEWFALYAGGLKVDIVFVPVQASAATLAHMLSHFAHQDVLQRGVRVLFDKSDLPAQAETATLATSSQAIPTPSSAEFYDYLNHFWITAAKTAKLIQRNDLWRAKQACDGELKACLLRMLEWHARFRYGPERDIWYEGRFLASWADPRATAELPATFANYDQADLRRALLASLRLHHWLAEETAASLSCQYPRPKDLDIASWISASLSD